MSACCGAGSGETDSFISLALPEYAADAEIPTPKFTLYAPTNGAVEALAGELGVEPEALVGADFLNTTAEIVWYHGVSEPAGTCGLDEAVSDCPTLVRPAQCLLADGAGLSPNTNNAC